MGHPAHSSSVRAAAPSWKDLEQVLYRYRMNADKDYMRFSKQLVEFGTERRYEAMRDNNGIAPMDVDNAEVTMSIAAYGYYSVQHRMPRSSR